MDKTVARVEPIMVTQTTASIMCQQKKGIKPNEIRGEMVQTCSEDIPSYETVKKIIVR